MKKIIFLAISICFSLMLQAQVSKTVNVSLAGGLSSALSSIEKNTITKLTIKGTIDYRDFTTMRDSMRSLSVLDLSGVIIKKFIDPNLLKGWSDEDNAIPGYAFSKCSGLKSIIIPSSVTQIQLGAFDGCRSLTSINIPSSVTVIESRAFNGCSSLTSVTIPSSVTFLGTNWYENGVFEKCSSLTSFNIPSSVTNIDARAFLGCSGLKSLTISSSVTRIQYSAFMDCSSLATLNIPSSVQYIEYNAFWGCSGLTSIYIPSSVTSIEIGAFRGCDGYFTVDANNPNYSSIDGVLYDKAQTVLIHCPISKTGSFIIPSSVISIGDNSFYGCSGLTSVSIPQSVNSIGGNYSGMGVFEGCTGLTSITIPSSVTYINESAFKGCTGLTSVSIPSSVTSIKPGLFSNCTGLTSITIPSSVTRIGDYGIGAFEGCTSLTSVSIPSSVISIGDNAFNGCSSLTSVNIPSSVIVIGGGAFQGCTGLTTVNIPSSVIYIGDDAFLGCSGFIELDVNNPNFSSLDGVLYNKAQTQLIQCPISKAGNFNIPSSVIRIGDANFGNGALFSCSLLTSVTIPSSVTMIGKNAFEGCSGLTSINIPSSVTSFGPSAFGSSIIVDANNPNYSSLDGVLYNKAKTVLIQCPTSKTGSFTIPSSVTSIRSGAFLRCSGLTSVNIPSSVTNIGNNAFEGCIGLSSINIPSSVVQISERAFGDCTGLTSATVHTSSIYYTAFDGCISLTSFYVLRPTPQYIGSTDFNVGNKANCTLYVPYGSAKLYYTDYLWREFKKIVEIGSSSLVFPKLTLNASLINAGQNTTIVGVDFKAHGTSNIAINGPDGFSQSVNNISTDGMGGFNYGFVTTATMPMGIYSINAIDNTSGLSAPVQKFTLKSTSVQTNNLKITSPLQSIVVDVNEKILIEWKDKMIQGKNYTLSGSKRNYKYTVELSVNNGSTWKTLKTVEGQEYINSWAYLNFSTSIATPGTEYVIRITDFYNSSNSQTTLVITVNQATQTKNIKADLNWDFSFPQPSSQVEGIAAEGTARIFLNLSKINSSSGPDISSVKVTLADDFNGTDPAKLGKVKVATQTSAYGSEANGTVAITETDNTAKKDNYIFWYVAPDDFAGANPKDLKSSSRIVTATFTVYYANGTTEILPKSIRIVRPPLMLVHGLASDASTWDNFRHNDLGYEMKFIEDFRFKTCIPVNILPDASFKANAWEMTFGNPDINTFQGIILDIRNKGYAANRVDYVCHSMGGCVLRSIYDNYYAYFTRTGIASKRPYKNYENGYVNKVVMIGTPNNSSPWADIVNRYAGDLSPLVVGGLQFWYGLPVLKKPLPLMFMQPADDKLVPTYKASDAVKDMQIDDTQGGVNFGVTNTKAHLIAGDFFPGAQFNTNGIIPQEVINVVKNTGDEKLQELLNSFLEIACSKEPDPILRQQLVDLLESKVKPIEKALSFLDKMAMVMDAFNTGTFIPESDLVVSVGSQLAGYSKPASNGVSNVSAFDDFVGHAFFRAETKNMDIGNRVNYLLNSSINSPLFDIIPATPAQPKLKSSQISLANAVIISKTDTTKLQIIHPENNSTVYVDSSFHVQFSIKDTTNLKSVELMFQNKTYQVDSLFLGTVDMNLQLNSSLLDNQKIVLEGYYLYPDSAIFVYDQINVNVITNDTLKGFGIDPKILYLFKNQIKNPEYYGIYKNSVTSGNFSSSINAIVNDTTIVKFDLTSKGFKGIATGETFAKISYEGFSDTIYFVVNETDINTKIISINQSPIANAGIDKSVNEGDIVSLDGSASSDGDGNALTYKWAAPPGITLSSSTVPKPTFTAPEVTVNTDYTFSLVVNDGAMDSPVDQVIITVKNVNKVPEANAGIDQSVNEGAIVALDGSASSDGDSNALTYKWTAPAGISLSSSTVAKPTFTAPEVKKDTIYTFTLIVNDGTVSSTADEVKITIKQVNKVPIANAGTDQSKNDGAIVALDGSASTDPDGSPLTYKWSAPAGITLSSTTSAKPTFTAPEVTINTSYTISLVVNDGTVDSPADQVVITVNNVNKAPVANAGTDQSKNEGAIVALDGSASTDPDGNPITYKWTAPAGITLSSTTSAKPTFTAPEVTINTSHTISLVVNDGTVDSPADEVVITVNNVNKAPVANAGPDQSVNEGAIVALDGSTSTDPDGNPITYKWTAPAGITLSSTTTAKPTFTTPQVSVNTDYTFSLVVNDGTVSSTTDEVKITVKQVNKVPVANAGLDQSVNEGAIVALDGSASTDPDGNPITYKWTAPAGITLSSTISAKPTFTAPEVTINTSYTISLVVNDGTVDSPADQVTITVRALPDNAGTIGGTTTVCQGQNSVTYTVTTIANATSYIWTLPTGATGTSATNSITVNYGTTAVSGNITVKGHNSCGDGVASTLAITVSTLPASAGAISGNASVYKGTSETYTVPAITGATSYIWTLSSGVTGTSTTNSITTTIASSAASGTVKVKGHNDCGDGLESSLAITINDLSSGVISGASSVCKGTAETYSVQSIAGATSYIWTLPLGTTGSSSTNSISVSFGANAVSSSIKVKGHNSGGDGAEGTLAINVNDVPSASGSITGNTSVCKGGSETYNLPAINEATSYIWTLPTGATGTSATNSITVNYGTTAVSGNITVKGHNSCGDGAASSLAITVSALPANAGAITGNLSAYKGTSETYTVPAITGATSYIWTLPTGVTGTSTTNSITTTIGSSVASGTIKVKGHNGCGDGLESSLAITINDLSSGVITGASSVCKGTAEIYSVQSIAGATSYIWTLPSGATGSSSTNSISVSFGTNALSGSIKVKGHNSGGDGAEGTLAITVNDVPSASGSITGNTSVCKGGSETYTVSAITGATSYIWTLPSGATGTSATNSITVNYGTTAVSGNITVKGHNSCGDGVASTLAITVSTLPASAGAISGNASVYKGTSETFTVPAITGATSYIWTLSSGVTGISTTNSITTILGSSDVSGTIKVKGHNGCGDGMESSLALTISDLSSGVITGAGSVCKGTAETYSVQSIAGATSYIWTLPTGATGSSSTNSISVSFGTNAVSGSIKVKGHNSGGDGAEGTLAITVNDVPSASGSITGNTSVCKGGSETYTVLAITGATSYIWTLPTGVTGTSATSSITVNYGTTAISGNITVKGHNSCGDGSISTLAITVNSKPETPIVTLNNNILHSNTSTGNQWYNQNVLINGATNQDYTFTAIGNFSVIVTLNGCASEPSIVNVVTGFDPNESNPSIKVYPNPITDELNIEFVGNTVKTEFVIVNSIGQVVFNGNLFEKLVIQTSNFSPGLYFIKLKSGKTIEFKKIVKL